MTDNPAPVPAPSVPPLAASPQQLVSEIIASLPQLSEKRTALTQVLTIWATYVGDAKHPVIVVDRTTALEELELTQNWSADSITTACEESMDALGEILKALQEEFQVKTGAKISDADFGAFERRYKAELKEQKDLMDRASQILEAVRLVASSWGLPNPDPAAQLTAKTTPRATLAAKLRGVKGLAALVDLPGGEKEEVGSEATSWMTDPAIDPDDKDLKLLALIQRRLQGSDIQTVKSYLGNLQLDDAGVIDLLKRIASKARQQLDQSHTILESVNADFRAIATQLQKIQEVQQVILDVNNFASKK